MTKTRSAALMALYTLLLALGAAAPIAASYAGPVGQRPSGYRAPVSAEAPEVRTSAS